MYYPLIVCSGMRITRNSADLVHWWPQATKMRIRLARLWSEETGQDLVEYVLVTALIALGSVAAMNSAASAVTTVFTNAVANMSSTTT